MFWPYFSFSISSLGCYAFFVCLRIRIEVEQVFETDFFKASNQFFDRTKIFFQRAKKNFQGIKSMLSYRRKGVGNTPSKSQVAAMAHATT